MGAIRKTVQYHSSVIKKQVIELILTDLEIDDSVEVVELILMTVNGRPRRVTFSVRDFDTMFADKFGNL